MHCEVRVRADGIVVKDCGSTNGTFVEGVRLVEGEVRPGALIRCGASVFRIEDEGGDAFLPLSRSDARSASASAEASKCAAFIRRSSASR